MVLTDRAVQVPDQSLYVTLIGSDFVEEGRRAARWLIEDNADRGSPIRVVELQGTVGSAPANDRMQGFREVIDKDARFEIVRTQSGDFTRAKGKEVMEAFIKAEGRKKIDVLFAHNDDMAIGAIQAIEEAGLKPGEDIRIVSIDGVRGAFEAMKAGKLNATVECNPLLGPQLAQLIRDVHAGKTGAEARGGGGGRVHPRPGRRRAAQPQVLKRTDPHERGGAARREPVQALRRHAGAGWREPRAARRRDPRTDGAERRGQVHVDQAAHRRRDARRGPDPAGWLRDRARHPSRRRSTQASAPSIRK